MQTAQASAADFVETVPLVSIRNFEGEELVKEKEELIDGNNVVASLY